MSRRMFVAISAVSAVATAALPGINIVGFIWL